MPIHDWTRVKAGIFHDFHAAWIISIRMNYHLGNHDAHYKPAKISRRPLLVDSWRGVPQRWKNVILA